MTYEECLCPFCFDKLNEEVVELRCGHIVHTACYEQLMAVNRCPVCNIAIDEDYYADNYDAHEEEYMEDEDYENIVALANFQQLVHDFSIRDLLCEQLRMLRQMEDRQQARLMVDHIINYAVDVLDPEELYLLMMEADYFFY